MFVCAVPLARLDGLPALPSIFDGSSTRCRTNRPNGPRTAGRTSSRANGGGIRVCRTSRANCGSWSPRSCSSTRCATHNRPLWYRSFPFHFGLYLLGGAVVGLLGGALTARLAADGAGVVARGTQWLAGLTGAIGLVLALSGAAGLLHRRLTDPALRVSTTPGDIFNLLFFMAALGLLGAGYLTRGAGAPGAFTLATGLLGWDVTLAVPPAMAAGVTATAVLAAYVPLTHMAHFIAKYFTYHSVRWDDEPMSHNARRAEAMAEYLSYRPTWSAPHIRGTGAPRTWGDVVADNPARESKR